MSSEQYSLAWNEFQTATSRTFQDLYSDTDLVDVTLACDDGMQVKAHKIILSSCSQFFKTILLKNPHQHPLIYVKGINHVAIQSIIRFIYLGQTEVEQESLDKFMEAAKELKIKGLFEAVQSACCWSQKCCLLKCLSKRIRDREVLRTQMNQSVPEESVHMIDMSNLRPIPKQTQIENVSPDTSRTMIMPSAPNMSIDSTVSSAHNMSNAMNMQPAPVQPLATSPHVHQPTYLSDCRSGYQSCFCLRGNKPCQGPMRQPPFQ